MPPLFTVISFPTLCVLLPIPASKITPKLESLKTNIYYLTVFVCQELQQWSSGPMPLTGYCQGTVISKLICGEDLLLAYLCGCRSASGSHWLLSGDISSWSCGLLDCEEPSKSSPHDQELMSPLNSQ